MQQLSNSAVVEQPQQLSRQWLNDPLLPLIQRHAPDTSLWTLLVAVIRPFFSECARVLLLLLLLPGQVPRLRGWYQRA
jgi:hypothetical protein